MKTRKVGIQGRGIADIQLLSMATCEASREIRNVYVALLGYHHTLQ